MKEKWTRQDEARFKEMEERRKRLVKDDTDKLVRLCGLMGLLNCANTVDVAEKLMVNADAIRDALEPFDSGVSEASEESAS